MKTIDTHQTKSEAGRTQASTPSQSCKGWRQAANKSGAWNHKLKYGIQ